jgi:hypothetical protein
LLPEPATLAEVEREILGLEECKKFRKLQKLCESSKGYTHASYTLPFSHTKTRTHTTAHNIQINSIKKSQQTLCNSNFAPHINLKTSAGRYI